MRSFFKDLVTLRLRCVYITRHSRVSQCSVRADVYVPREPNNLAERGCRARQAIQLELLETDSQTIPRSQVTFRYKETIFKYIIIRRLFDLRMSRWQLSLSSLQIASSARVGD